MAHETHLQLKGAENHVLFDRCVVERPWAPVATNYLGVTWGRCSQAASPPHEAEEAPSPLAELPRGSRKNSAR